MEVPILHVIRFLEEKNELVGIPWSFALVFYFWFDHFTFIVFMTYITEIFPFLKLSD